MGDLVCVVSWFDILFFLLDIQRRRIFFPALHAMKVFFFSVGFFFRQVFPCKKFFPLETRLHCRIIFSEITYLYPPPRSKGRPLIIG